MQARDVVQPHATSRGMQRFVLCHFCVDMQSSDDADNSSAPSVPAKAATSLRSRRSWGLRRPKKASAEAEDVDGAEATVADQGSKSMTEGSSRYDHFFLSSICKLPIFPTMQKDEEMKGCPGSEGKNTFSPTNSSSLQRSDIAT